MRAYQSNAPMGQEAPFSLRDVCSPCAQACVGLSLLLKKNCGQDGDEGGWELALWHFVEASGCGDNSQSERAGGTPRPCVYLFVRLR